LASWRSTFAAALWSRGWPEWPADREHLSRQLPAVGPRRTFRGFWSALNEPVFVTTNGPRRKIPKREALVNETAGANSRATKMLIHMMKDIEKKTSAEPPPKPHRHRPSPCD